MISMGKNRLLDPNHTTRYLYMRQPVTLYISGDLIDTRTKRLPVGRHTCIYADPVQQLRNPLHFERRAKVTGEHLTFYN